MIYKKKPSTEIELKTIRSIHQAIKEYDKKISFEKIKPISIGGLFKLITLRDKIILFIGIILSVLIIFRLNYIIKYERVFLQIKQDNNVIRNIPIIQARGGIFDRNGLGLAVSTPINELYINKKQYDIKNNESFQKILKKYNLNFDLNKFTKNSYISRNLTPKQGDTFKNIDIKGVIVLENYKRFYPLGNSISNLLGKTNIDDFGIDGIEYSYNNYLKSDNGNQKITKTLKGDVVDFNITKQSISGSNLKLTINSDFQITSYRLLMEQVKQSNAKGGAVIILDAKTGEILAMTSYPSLNPNIQINSSYKKQEDPTYQTVFDPGSIMKPLVIAKAIDDKKVLPTTILNTTPYRVGTKIIKDDHPMNSMSVSQIIQFSSDIGTSKIALMYKPQDLYNYYKSLGFGTKTGLHLNGETKGILNNYKRWMPMDQALMSFGYGISITLLQIASSYTIFTNNGCILKPKLIYNNKPSACLPLISPKTTNIMRDILESTVTNGTAKKAGSSNFSVAGKTGTAQKLINGRYVSNAHVASFVGFAPVKNSKYIVAVMIDEPKNGYYASSTAAPLFQKIMTYIINK